MSMTTIASIGLGGMLLLMVLHVPIGVSLLLSGLVAFGLMAGLQPALALLASEPAGYLVNLDLAVIPLFLLMGMFAGAAGLSTDLYRLAAAFLGHRRGGLAYATIGGCAGFGAICGSSIATVATMTRVALPEMRDRHYDEGFAAGTIAAGGTLGILIPPSIAMVVYAVLTEQFIVTMFAAAILPAVVAVAFQFAAIAAYVRFRPGLAPTGVRADWTERRLRLRQSWRVFVLIASVSGGIYTGIFTATEAAAVGCVLAALFAWVRGRLTWAALRDTVLDTATTTAMIYLMVIGASLFTFFLTASRLPAEAIAWIQQLGWEPLMVMLAIVVFYIILGCFFETLSALVITLPFVFPLVIALGYDPVWFGIVCVMVVELGLITPPMGMNLFVINGMAPHVSIARIAVGTLPFLVSDMARLLLLILLPSLALWLPKALGLH